MVRSREGTIIEPTLRGLRAESAYIRVRNLQGMHVAVEHGALLVAGSVLALTDRPSAALRGPSRRSARENFLQERATSHFRSPGSHRAPRNPNRGWPHVQEF